MRNGIDFTAQNQKLAEEAVNRLLKVGRHGAVIAEAPPGAGKSTLTVAVANNLLVQDKKLRIAVVTQTNEQADDLVGAFVAKHPSLAVARLTGSGGASAQVHALGDRFRVSNKSTELEAARVVVSTARKWQYERAAQAKGFSFALVDEAYQMRSDALLGVADLFDTLFCVGDPGQLDPFTIIDDSVWKGLPHSPSRPALAVLRQFHPDLEPMKLQRSWRLPPSAAGMVARAFYPGTPFEAGTAPGDRELSLGRASRRKVAPPVDDALDLAAKTGWAWVELPERFTSRTDLELAGTLAALVTRLFDRGAQTRDELAKPCRALTPGRVAVIAAHNDQVHAVRHALAERGFDPDSVVVSTANKIQGREYDVVFVWHPLAGRRDATAFHLEAGRMCVMLSRHRQACVVVGRAGAGRLLEEFPDSDPLFIDEPEKFPDGWQANHAVLDFLGNHRVGLR